MEEKKEGSKRVKARIESKLTVAYRQSGTAEKQICKTNDISEYGVQIITEQELDKEKNIFLEIDLPYPKCMIQAIGKIRWYKPITETSSGNPMHLYGVQYDEIDQIAQDNIFLYMYERFKYAAGDKKTP
jgi:c-di-GMP-binding flagellar brake protein YcgR